MKISYLTISLVLLLVFVACEDGGAIDQPAPTFTATVSPTVSTATAVPPTAIATPGFFVPKPPPATLTIAGQTQTSGVGTYCWVNGKAGLCLDAVGIITPKTPLEIRSPTIATINLPISQQPTTFSMRVTKVSEADEMNSSLPDGRIWNPIRVQGQELPTILAAKQDVRLNLQPGLYIIRIFTAWEGYGDVVYGFLVEVK